MAGATILVVDDDAPIRRMLERTLAAEGYRVETAGDGGAALAAVERSVPELLVLDVSMPGMGGLDVTLRVPDHDRSLQLDVQLPTRPQKQLRCWLAAATVRAWDVGADIDALDCPAGSLNQRGHLAVDCSQLILGEEPSAHNRLVCNHDNA